MGIGPRESAHDCRAFRDDYFDQAFDEAEEAGEESKGSGREG